jgi:hypothetical protein
MDWHDWLRVLRWRAIEEGDAAGSLLSLERRRQATARNRAGLESNEIATTPLGEREQAYLDRRSRWLETEALGWRGPLIKVLKSLRVRHVRPFFTSLGWALALLIGWSALQLGQASEFNLLALPLVGLLLWNAVMIIVSLITEMLPSRRVGIDLGGDPWKLPSWLLEVPSVPSATQDDPVAGAVRDHFQELATPLAWTRIQRRFRAWLHVGAALMALGGCVSIYAQGWSTEYRAVWESTLLNEASASRFFGALFAPASGFLGIEIPLDDLDKMRRTAGQAAAPAPALPWLHLYAGTLMLLVVLPRLLLAGLSLARSRQVTRLHARHLAWDGFLRTQLHAIEGGEDELCALVHASSMTEHQVEAWSAGLREQFGGATRIRFELLNPGEESEFLESWKPPDARIVIIFHLATTPEEEVHGELMDTLRAKATTMPGEPRVIALLEASGPAQKWAAERFEGREKLWSRLLKDRADQVMVSIRRENLNSPALPAAEG